MRSSAPTRPRLRAQTGALLLSLAPILGACSGAELDDLVVEEELGEQLQEVTLAGGKALLGLGGKCASVQGKHPGNRAPVVLQDCDGSASQAWEYDSSRGEYRAFGKCLDVAGGVFANRTPMQLYECNGTISQKFKRYGKTLRPTARTAFCVEVKGGFTTNGTPIQLYDCNGTASQDWLEAKPISMLGLAGKCMTIKDGSTAKGTPVVLSTCQSTASQRWYYDTSTGELHARGKCLDVSGGTFANRTPLQLWDCNNTAAQRFGWYGRTFRPKANTHYCVEVKGGFTSNGTPIQLYDCNNTASQHWQSVTPVPQDWSTLFSQFDNYDYNDDGTAELNRLAHLNLGSVPGDFAQSSLNARPLVVVFVDPRILTSVPGGKTRWQMLSLLTQYAADLKVDGFAPVFVEADAYRGTRNQDGRVVLAMREVLRTIAYHYPKLHGTVLLGDFPTTFHAQRTMTTKNNPWVNGTQYPGQKALAIWPHLYNRADIVLGDLDGRWEDLYHETVSIDRVLAIPRQSSFPLNNQTITSTTYAHDALTWNDIFFLKEDTMHRLTDSSGQLQFTVSQATNRDPELSLSDKRSGRTTALPEILVSRINARHVALKPTTPPDVYGNGPLDAAGHPQTLYFDTSTNVTWDQDLGLEQTIVAEYLARNHQFRRGLTALTPFRTGSLRGLDSRLGNPTNMANYLKRAADGFGTPLVRDAATAPAFFQWLQQPAILRSMQVHSDATYSSFTDARNPPVPYVADPAGLLTAVGGHAWNWKKQHINGYYRLTPQLDDNGNLTYYHMRSAWENGALVSGGPSFFVHAGCNSNTAANEETLPYSDPRYGTLQNAETLLFFGNGLAVMARGKDNNDFPTNFAEPIREHQEFGEGWRGYFETFTDRSKKSYFWSVLGDFTLKLTRAPGR